MKLATGAVVKGGTALLYKTGTWRTQKPVIDLELCKDCGICEMVCPDSAIHKYDNKYVIDYDYCKGCGICAFECSAKAIEIVFEVK